ncbi:agmatinase, mitochondrial-like [Ptychodera flava]|uniref:agmatinase, mitochondrial-like n=1 Tax=Ptychodera flava TaxID=63121 RepID=UPI003969CEF2
MANTFGRFCQLFRGQLCASNECKVKVRWFSMELGKWKKFNRPLNGSELARSGGIASMCRLPIQATAEGLDVCFVGIPLDTGSSNRSGSRLGPRQIRTESCIIGAYNTVTGAAPFESLQVADIGDVNINLYDLKKACEDITEFYKTKILPYDCKPLTLGGDHTISYPILKALKEKHGPLGMIHIDAHCDTLDEMMGEKIGHGTPFRRAVDDGLLDCKRVVTLGLRGQASGPGDDWKIPGFRYIWAHQFWNKSMQSLMDELRQHMGSGPVYISFDIDALDPSIAPGTGYPEIGGLTSMQVLEIIQGCKGLDIIGGDLVEVSPPYDPTGTTALVAANFLFEMLCVIPGVKYYPVSHW